MKRLCNFILFQVCWFAAVLGVTSDWTWQLPTLVLASTSVHLAWVASDPWREAAALIAVALLGLLVDTLLLRTGVLLYGGQALLGILAPAWILALWFCFATTFHASMNWLQGRPWLAALFGALGAPLSYLGGARLGALSFREPLWSSALAVAIAWGIAMPLLLWISARIVQRTPGVICSARNSVGRTSPRSHGL